MTNETTARRPRLDELLLTADDDRRVTVGCPTALPSTPDWTDEQAVETLGEALAAGRRHLDRFHPEPAAEPAPGDEMRAMLVAGAELVGRLNLRGAVHLLTFTDLPGWRGFRGLVDLVDATPLRERGLTEMRDAALVRRWSGLEADTRAVQISGSGRRLLELAVSMAAGVPVDLYNALAGFGHAHARRVLEAVAIATGADQWYTLTGTPALDELLAAQRAMTEEAR